MLALQKLQYRAAKRCGYKAVQQDLQELLGFQLSDDVEIGQKEGQVKIMHK